MKEKLILVLYLLIVKIGFGQNYSSFSADTTIWWAESKNTIEEGSLCTRQFTYLFGDTVFNALHYKKIYQSNYYYYSFAEAKTDLANQWQFKGYLRDDIPNKKVYFSPSTVLGVLNSEQLLYDFNLQIGDTLPHSYIYRNQHQTVSGIAQKLTISGINNITINGIAYKRYFFAGLNNQTAYITEAIGTSVGLLEPLAMSQNTYPVLTKKVMFNNWNTQDFVVINNCTFCPSYKQFPTDSAYWEYVTDYREYFGGVYDYFYYKMYDDTIISNIKYKQVFKSVQYCKQTRPSCSCGDWKYVFAMRYDSINKAVFVVMTNETKIQKIYDFNIKNGNPYFYNIELIRNPFNEIGNPVASLISVANKALSFSVKVNKTINGGNFGDAKKGLVFGQLIPDPFSEFAEYGPKLVEFKTTGINYNTGCLTGIENEFSKKQDLILIKNKENEIELESTNQNATIESLNLYDIQGKIIKKIENFNHTASITFAKPQNTILFLNIKFSNGKIYTTKVSMF